MRFVPISLNGVFYEVAADYYFDDGIRMPLGYPDALAIAQAHNCQLPTKELVDEIWKQADLKLAPEPMPAGTQMTTINYFRQHHALIEKQLDGREFTLLAGHKKDVLPQRVAGKVTIYGWHKLDGTTIQNVSSKHADTYRDYSHGIRLVRKLV